MSPLVESPQTTMSPLLETSEPTPSPLMEDEGTKRILRHPHLVAADSVDSVATSGIDSPVVPFDESLTGGGGGGSAPNTPKVKFMVGSSSGFCTPCDSGGHSPNPMYTEFMQQTSYPAESSRDKNMTSASPKTPTRECSMASLLRVQSAPALLETAPFRRKGVVHVGTTPGLLETTFCTNSCDSDCTSTSSQDSGADKRPAEGGNVVESPRDRVSSSQQEVEMDSGVQPQDTTQNEGSTNNDSTLCDVVSEPEVSSSSDVQC